MLGAIGKLANQFHPVSFEGTPVEGRYGSNCWQQAGLYFLAAGLTGGMIGAQESISSFFGLVMEGMSTTFDSVTSLEMA